MKRTIKWSELGKPSTPGKVLLEGLGCVDVSKEKVEAARRCGGDPVFVLLAEPAAQKHGDYRLGGIRNESTKMVNYIDHGATPKHAVSRYPHH